jgi:hypothetical protein
VDRLNSTQAVAGVPISPQAVAGRTVQVVVELVVLAAVPLPEATPRQTLVAVEAAARTQTAAVVLG